jgi:murein DD-endopeptidase MepM/ murein hydrolase activator NlpD
MNAARITLVVTVVALSGCAMEAPIEFELPEDGGDGGLTLLTTPPRLRSPFAGSERVTSHVSNTSGGRTVDYACRAMRRRGHRGTDFGVPVGTPIHAAAAGRVIRRVDGCPVGNGSCGGGFGNHVILLHAGGRATLYAHLRSGSGLPAMGATVGCGQRIGASGNSGRSTGPHLHFEVRDGVRDVGSYYASRALDPWGGRCSTQATALWMDGTPGPTCDGGDAAPRDHATYVSATHPRRVRVRPEQEVVQRWTLRNTGTTTWEQARGYQLRFVSGTSFGRTEPIPLPVARVAPGGTATFELRARAASTVGVQRGQWRMAIGDRGVFGDSVYLELEVSAPARPRSCRSATLGREVPDGDCVQVDYAGCGASSCAWWSCDDGAWTCAGEATCRGTAHGHASCAPRMDCEAATDCGACTTQPGCAWSPSASRCVAEGDAAHADASGDPSVCQACRPVGAVCQNDAGCCGSGDGGSVRCVLGFCTDTAGCGMVGAGCAGRSDCCGQIVCEANAGGDRACCLRNDDRCSSSADCCGAMECTDGRCACRQRGQSCVNLSDCCGGMLCIDGVCGF